jgi:hypothetical protein
MRLIGLFGVGHNVRIGVPRAAIVVEEHHDIPKLRI